MKTIDYRKTIEHAIQNQFPHREFLQPLARRALWLCPHAIAIAAAAYVITCTNLHLILKLAGSLVIGSSFASLGFLGHEFLHGSILKTRWLAGLLGGLCMTPFAVPPTLWRWWHNDQHHGHTQVYERDPDASARLPEYHQRLGLRVLSWLTSGKPLVAMIVLGFWFPFHTVAMLKNAWHRLPEQRFTTCGQWTLAVCGCVLPAWWLGLGNWLLVYGLPTYIGGFILMSFIATNHLLNHQTGEDDLDPVTTSLSLRMPWLFRVLYLNFNYHTAHHLYKNMSSKYAPLISDVVKRTWPERYHELSWPRAVLTLCRTPRLHLDEFTLIDPRRQQKTGVLGHGLEV